MSLWKLASFTSLLFLSCLSDTQTETKYDTTYSVDLSAIDPALQVDSVIVVVEIDGERKTVPITGAQLESDSIDLPVIRTKEGQIIELEYIVYVDDIVVATGTDTYDPEKTSVAAVPLELVEDAINTLVAAQKNSSSLNSSNSATSFSSSIRTSSTAQSSSSSVASGSSSSSSTWTLDDFDMAFLGTASTLLEDVATGSIQLSLTGPTNAVLPSNLTYALTFSGTATKDVDYNATQSSVTFLKGAKVGDKVTYSIQAVADNLVEGSESVSLVLGATGLSLLNKEYTLTLVDADSAWVEFKNSIDTIPEDKGSSQNVVLKLRTNNASAVLAKAASVIVTTNENSSTAKYPTNYADFDSPVTLVFPVNSSNTTEKFIAIIPKDIAGYNQNQILKLDLAHESGDVGVSAGAHSVVFKNTDYEYFALLKKGASTSSVVLFSPDLDSLITSPIKTNSGNLAAVAIALNEDSTGLIAMVNDGTTLRKNATDLLWTQQSSGPSPAVGGVLDFGLCSDGLLTVMVSNSDSINIQVRNTSPTGNFWGAILADRKTGSTTLSGFVPCNGKVSGGLIIQKSPTRSIYLGSYSSGNIALNSRANATDFDYSALALIPNMADRTKDTFYATYGVYLRWQLISSTSSSSDVLNLDTRIGTTYMGAQKLLSTPRGTLIFVTQDSLIETTTAGVYIKARKHSLGAIADAQYIPFGYPSPSP